MNKLLYFRLILPLFLVLQSCQGPEINTPTFESESKDDGGGVWLRSTADEGLFIAGIDGEAKTGTLWISHATEDNRFWTLDEPKTISGSGHFFAFYPAKGLAVNQYGAVRVDAEPFGEEYYYYKGLYGKTTNEHTISLKKLMVHFKVTLDLSGYKGKKHLKKIELIGVPKRALVDVRTGSVTRVESLGRTEYGIDEIVGDRYDFAFYSFPAEENDVPCFDVYLDDRIFCTGITVANNRPWRAGEEYTTTVGIRTVDDRVEVVDGVRQQDRIEYISTGYTPTYQVSCTNNRWRTLPKGQSVLLGMFINNVDSEDFIGDIRLTLEDESGRLVQQGTYWSNHRIKQGLYEGLRLPFCAKVSEGKYRLQVLLRKNGDTKWFRPDIAFDSDTEDDWLVEVKTMPKVSAVRSYIDLDKKVMFAEGTFRTLKLNQPYTYSVRINSYEPTDKQATIRLYHERNASLNGHSEYVDREKETPKSWKDLLAELSVVIPAQTSSNYKIPYTISVRRPNFRRYASYIYATIQYPGEEESPLLIDTNNVYNLSMGVDRVLGSGATLSKYLNAYPHTNVCVIALE